MKQSIFEQHRRLILLLLIAFVDIMGIGLVYPLFSGLLFDPASSFLTETTSQSTRGLLLGVLLATMPLIQFFSCPLLGTLSDQKGRKPVLVMSLWIGVIGYGLGVVSIGLKSFLMLLLSRALVGISGGNMAVVSASVADLSSPETKARNFGLLGMAGWGLGFAVGPYFGGRLMNLFGGGRENLGSELAWVPFAFAGILTLLNWIFICLFFRETHFKRSSATLEWMKSLRHLKKAFTRNSLQAFFIGVFLVFLGWSFYIEFIPVTWISEYHLTSKEIGTFYGFGALVYAISAGLLLGPLTRRFSTQQLLLTGPLFLTAFIWLMLPPIPMSWVWGLLALQNISCAFIFPLLSVVMSNQGTAQDQGELLGILQAVEAFSLAVSPALSGVLLGWHIKMPILLGGLILVSSVPFFRKILLKTSS